MSGIPLHSCRVRTWLQQDSNSDLVGDGESIDRLLKGNGADERS
jgi:hypothetical protein